MERTQSLQLPEGKASSCKHSLHPLGSKIISNSSSVEKIPAKAKQLYIASEF